MKHVFKQIVWTIFAVVSLCPVVTHTKSACKNECAKQYAPVSTKCFKHTIQLQLSDVNGFPVEGTEFWVPLDITKTGSQVTIQLPTINFQTGQIAADDYYGQYHCLVVIFIHRMDFCLQIFGLIN